MSSRGALVAIAWIALVACDPRFDSSSLITRNRVLAARSEVKSDAGLASPLAGETVNVSFLVVDEAQTRPLSWALAACPQGPPAATDLFCAGPVFSTSTQSSPVDPEERAPGLEFEVPASTASVLVLGVICADGTPTVSFDSTLAECEGRRAQETKITFSIPVANNAEETNQNPSLEEAAVFLDGIMLEPTASPADVPCSELDLPRFEPQFEDATLRTVSGLENVEEYRDDDGSLQIEDPFIAHYTTAGKLDREFSVFGADNMQVDIPWAWPASKDVPAEGLLVRFHFVIRDRREGADWTTRSICVVR